MALAMVGARTLIFIDKYYISGIEIPCAPASVEAVFSPDHRVA
jgi:hypothetical protein